MDKKMISSISKISCSLLTSVLTLLLTANVAEASKVTGTKINVRKEASKTAEAFDQQLTIDDKLNLLDFDGTFLKVSKDENIGYVYYDKTYIYIEEEANATIIDGPTRIRTSASLQNDSNVVANVRLNANDRVYVLTQKGDFYVIEYNHALYYVHCSLVSLDANIAQVDIDEKTIEEAIKNKDNVEENKEKMHEEYNVQAAEETVSEESKEQVVNEENKTNEEVQEISEEYSYYTSADILNLRQQPNTNCTILKKLYGGSQIEILETLDGWYKINYNGTVGYVSSEYVVKVLSKNKIVTDSMQLLGILYNHTYNEINIDCSGLTYYVYKILNGINIPRCSRDQANVNNYKNAIQVSFENLQPGDLVFFYSGCSHVGMYIGNGEFIQAENYGIETRITKFYGDEMDYNHWGENFTKAIRIITE